MTPAGRVERRRSASRDTDLAIDGEAEEDQLPRDRVGFGMRGERPAQLAAEILHPARGERCRVEFDGQVAFFKRQDSRPACQTTLVLATPWSTNPPQAPDGSNSRIPEGRPARRSASHFAVLTQALR